MCVLVRRAKVKHRFDHAAVIPRAVKKYHVTCGGQVFDITLEIPLTAFGFRRFGQRHNPSCARIEIFADAVDCAAFSRGITPFKHHGDACAAVAYPVLQFHQFDLKLLVGAIIYLARQTVRMGISGRDDVAFFGPAHRIADLFGGVVFVIGADRTVKGQVHEVS